MSKPEKAARIATANELRKDLSQATKFLKTVTNSLESIEINLEQSEAAISNEKHLRDKIANLEEANVKLREENKNIQTQQQQKSASFLDSILELHEEFRTRQQKTEDEFDMKLKNLQSHVDQEKLSWRQKIEKEKIDARREKDSQIKGYRDIEIQLQKANADREEMKERFKVALQDNGRQVAEYEEKIKVLMHDLNSHKTILMGRETEIQLHKDRLASLEVFAAGDPDRLVANITMLQRKTRDFCVRCIEIVEMFPWNRFPDGLRYEHLPQAYQAASSAGRHVLTAALQHSVCRVLTEGIFVPFGPCAGPDFVNISNALYKDNQSHEAIWRLMTVNMILQDAHAISSSSPRLREMADALITSWKLFSDKQQIGEVYDMMIRFFVESARTWLELMKVRNRIQVSDDVQSQYFDSDSEEERHNVPGDIKLPDSTSPVLCLFPAFFWNATPDATARLSLLKKGTAMFRDSPFLLLALEEEKVVSSPRTTHRKIAKS